MKVLDNCDVGLFYELKVFPVDLRNFSLGNPIICRIYYYSPYTIINRNNKVETYFNLFDNT